MAGLSVFFFFLGFAFVGRVKKNFVTYDFDPGHLELAPVFGVTGAAGMVSTTFFTWKITSV